MHCARDAPFTALHQRTFHRTLVWWLRSAGQSTVVIVEGEFDKLALAEAGIYNCVSLPQGALTGQDGENTREAYELIKVNAQFLQVGLVDSFWDPAQSMATGASARDR